MKAFERSILETQDLELLGKLLSPEASLTGKEREAFEDMLESLRNSRRDVLTENQRSWCRKVWLEIDVNRMHVKMLRCVLVEWERLRSDERDAFIDMLESLTQKRRTLTRSQYEWLQKVADRLGVVTESLNLHSAGLVPEGLARLERLLPCEQPGYRKPVKPPGFR